MERNGLDDRKILLAVICKSKSEMQQQFDVIKSLRTFRVSDTFKVEFSTTLYFKSMAATCNYIRQNNDAKYIIFITAPIVALEENIFTLIIKTFFTYPKVGIIGLMGSEIPLSGDCTQAKNIYGTYFYMDEANQLQAFIGKMPIFYQSVHVVDPCFFVTSEYILFDERIGDDFFIAAQCCRYRQSGYDVGVIHSENVLVIFAKDNCMYFKQNVDDENYKSPLHSFKALYKDDVTPLVSICIPTYNQPKFFETALQGALSQTYDNIEIIVGDDSTNEDTKELIQPYLKRYANIKYFHHGKPLGGRGLKNVTFIVNKSSGKYINVLFHDDEIYPTKISRMMEYFIRDLENKIVLTTSARNEINEKDEVTKRMNPWQPSRDVILSGEDVGRKILFAIENFIGELSTVLLKRESLLSKDPETGEKIFDIGIFCGVKDVVYGDMSTWLNVLKSGGECVFIKDVLSAFRKHSAQNGDNPVVRARLPLEFMGYITISWLNGIFLRNFDEYKTCCKHWDMFFFGSSYFKEMLDDAPDDIKFSTNVLEELHRFITAEKYDAALDCSIKFLLDMLSQNNSIRPLIKRNAQTGLWEKADDGIMLHGMLRC